MLNIPEDLNNSFKISQFPLVFLLHSRLDEHGLSALVHQNQNRVRLVFDHISPFLVVTSAECGEDVPVLIDVLENVIVLELSEVVVHEDVTVGIFFLQLLQDFAKHVFRIHLKLLVVNLVIV